ncbi:hypothetical protein [Propionibacterium australiense]|uniref:Uncharacterized protein n=1 Tax=Propionibacterium australiense TaxID=119981 RepID=A0A383SB78_9ACTN|nr:hypothetical protein [Propionibacterium australiense]SYZ34639.1 Hypothetical protein PROPAUS_2678 [Propionibacterium australiense]VEH91919.1 Uncharacterised protein [Propionibacterium australiense]
MKPEKPHLSPAESTEAAITLIAGELQDSLGREQVESILLDLYAGEFEIACDSLIYSLSEVLPELSEEQAYLLEQLDPTILEADAIEELRTLISLVPRQQYSIDASALDVPLHLSHMLMRHYSEISLQSSQAIITLISSKEYARATIITAQLLVDCDCPVYSLDIQQLTWLTDILELNPDQLKMIENTWDDQKRNRRKYLPGTRGHLYRNPRSWKGEGGPFDH